MELTNFFFQNLETFSWLFLNMDLLGFQGTALRMMFYKNFFLFVATRGASKSTLACLGAILLAIFSPGIRIVMVAPAFRQTKFLFQTMQEILDKSPLLQEMATQGIKTYPDACHFPIGRSLISGFPLGDGKKIRGARSHATITDEFAQVNEIIYHEVIEGMGAVSLSPVERVRAFERGLDLDVINSQYTANRQIMLSTAYYAINHLYTYYQAYSRAIREGLAGEAENPDWKKMGLMRLPWYVIPQGFMSPETLNHARQYSPANLFAMEYETEFPKDSDNFFPITLLERQTLTSKESPNIELRGKEAPYFIGIDPARHQADCAIVVLKGSTDEKKASVVYAWSQAKRSWPDVTRHLRELLRRFNCQGLGIEQRGGGAAITDLLQDSKFLEHEADELIWSYPELDKDTRAYKGRHCLWLINSTSPWVTAINHQTLAALEQRKLWFASMPLVYDFANGGMEMDDVSDRIRHMKAQMQLIEMTIKPSGAQHFDVPEGLGWKDDTRQGVKKDLYSALLMGWAVYDYWFETRHSPSRVRARGTGRTAMKR